MARSKARSSRALLCSRFGKISSRTRIQHLRGVAYQGLDSAETVEGTDLQNVFEVSTCTLFQGGDAPPKLLNGIAAKGGDLTEPVWWHLIHPEPGHVLEGLPCIKQVYCSSAKCIEDPDIVFDDVAPEPDIIIMKNVDWHNLSWFNTEFSMVCILGCVSEYAGIGRGIVSPLLEPTILS